MSRSVLSGGMLIGGISRASVCEFVEFTFIGILKTEHTPKASCFSTKPPNGRGYISSKARGPAPVFLQLFQVKRLMLGISLESAINRMARIAHRDFTH